MKDKLKWVTVTSNGITAGNVQITDGSGHRIPMIEELTIRMKGGDLIRAEAKFVVLPKELKNLELAVSPEHLVELAAQQNMRVLPYSVAVDELVKIADGFGFRLAPKGD